MSKRPKILYLVGTDPRNTSYGGEQRTHFIWEALKKVAEVHTVIPVAHKRSERVDESDNIRWVCFERRWTPGWILRRIWSRFFPRVDLPCRGVKTKIKRMFPFSFDACVARYLTMASYIKAWGIAPLFVDVDDFESERVRSMAVHGCFQKREIVAKLIQLFEKKILRKATHAWVVIPDHLPFVSGLCSVSLLPNIPLLPEVSLADTTSDGHILITVGLMGHPPNYLGVDGFLRRHWAEILEVFPDAIYKIAGAGLPEKYVRDWSHYENVRILGFVDDLVALYKEALCVLVPIESGSGSCIKVMEALGMGRVCLATPFAVRGVLPDGIRLGNGIVIYHTTSEIIQGIQLISDEVVRSKYQHEGQQYINQHYSQNVVDVEIQQTLDNQIASQQSSST